MNCKNLKYRIKKGTKHKLTKATKIPIKVKKVWERDDHKCIYCHCEVPLSCANSHYIKRSQLGLGIPHVPALFATINMILVKCTRYDKLH